MESCKRVCSLVSILIETHMYEYVYVYGCLNISVPVSVHAHACASGSLFCMFVSKGSSDSHVLPARQSVRPRLPRSCRGRHGGLGCADSAAPVPCAACQFGIQDTGATHNAVSALLHAAAGACFVFVVCCCCVGVPVVDVGMYVCASACYACCGVLQRRHSFDEFAKRIGKRQPQEVVRHWLGTETRDSLLDDGLCGHLRV